ncbi:hypothetical protein L6452_01432 [Arctium lappa]|uniref:Uncharacterized protein n=1 Tax=Arctium lappa TaxID=4217 RepID=A0ACB9FG39_ARCLA|nr:hypothetical protein L6452_01432 [Arctium lappa]
MYGVFIVTKNSMMRRSWFGTRRLSISSAMYALSTGGGMAIHVLLQVDKETISNAEVGDALRDDTSSVMADVCLNDLDANKLELRYGFGLLDAHARALKGLIELVSSNRDSCTIFISADNLFMVGLIILRWSVQSLFEHKLAVIICSVVEINTVGVCVVTISLTFTWKGFLYLIQLATLVGSQAVSVDQKILHKHIEQVLLSGGRFKLILGHLQLDNQLPLTLMPVLLAPEEASDMHHPVFKMTITICNENHLPICLHTGNGWVSYSL